MISVTKGFKLALLTALISGVSIFINKFTAASLENPLILPVIKNSLVGFFFVGLLIGTKKLHVIKTLNKKQILQLVAVGIIGGSLPFYLFFMGLSSVSAVNANILHKTMVIWVALLALPLLKERVSKTQGLAILIMFAGNLAIGGFKGLTFSAGELMVLCATLLWALETVFVKKILANVEPNVIAAARMGLGSLVLIVISTVISPTGLISAASLNITQWSWIVLTSIVLFGYVSLWYRALQHAPAISVSTVLVSSTLVTNVLSAIFITRELNPVLTYQNLFLSLGLVLLIFSNKKSHYRATN